MTSTSCAVVVLGAGKGTRMKSSLPKVLNPIAGQAMVNHVLDAARPLSPKRTVVVIGPDMDNLAQAVAPVETAVQEAQMGTADAVKAARSALSGFNDGAVLIVFGDTPFITTDTMARMLEAQSNGADVVVLGFEPDNPTGYGRLVRDGEGELTAIVEQKDASEEELKIGLCNSGVMAVNAARMFDWLDRIGNDNANGEYYLTDIVALAREDGCRAVAIVADESELLGINSKADLARAEALWQTDRRERAMAEGTTLLDPASVWFAHDTKLGRDVVISQNVVFGPGVEIGDDVTIKSFSHLEGARVEDSADVGPYARLRPGAVVGSGARVGNFVEVKNSRLGEGAKANHLTYLGDAEIGAGANVGAGTITCNYDGYLKSKTEIGEGAFIGSNSALVAPVTIGAGAIVGAGSVVTADVPDDAIAVARGDQALREGAAAGFREKRAAQKAEKQKK